MPYGLCDSNFQFEICNLKFEIFRYHPISLSPYLPIFVLNRLGQIFFMGDTDEEQYQITVA